MKLELKTRPAALESERRRKARLRAINRRIVRDAKKSGCWICGKSDLPSCDLHYHHRDPKKKRRKVCHMINSATETLVEEISQCRLWCRWSHQRFHATGETRPCGHAFHLQLRGGPNDC